MRFAYSSEGLTLRYVMLKGLPAAEAQLAAGQDFSFDVNGSDTAHSCTIPGRGAKGQKCTDSFEWSGKVTLKTQKAHEEP